MFNLYDYDTFMHVLVAACCCNEHFHLVLKSRPDAAWLSEFNLFTLRAKLSGPV